MEASQPGECEAGFEEVDGKPEHEVCNKESAVSIALAIPWSAQPKDKCNQKQGLIELGWMAVDAVSEVNAPRQGGRDSIGVVGKALQEASNASDCHSDDYRNREKISGPAGDPCSPLDPLHCERATQQSADDGLAGKQVERLEHVPQSRYGVFKPVKNPAAQRRPDDGGSDHAGAIRGREEISVQLAAATVHVEPDEVRK